MSNEWRLKGQGMRHGYMTRLRLIVGIIYGDSPESFQYRQNSSDVIRLMLQSVTHTHTHTHVISPLP